MFDGLFDSFGWGDAIKLGGTLLGYNASQDAAEQQAQTMNNLGAQAASMAQFKPYSVTSGFGTGYFDTAKQTAGYQLNPVLEAFRNKMYGGSASVLDQLNLDPTQAAQQYMAEQQGLLQPTRQAEDIALRNQQLNRGRIGLGISGAAVGAGGNGMVNPEQYQRDLARAQADAAMAAGSRQQAQADIDRLIGRSTGLFNTGAGIEQLGMGAMTTGADLGKAGSAAGASAGTSLLDAGAKAALFNYQAGKQSADMYGALGSSLGGMFATPKK